MLTKAQEAARSAAIDAGLNPGTLKAFPDGWEQPTGVEVRLVLQLANLTGSKAGDLTGTDSRSVRRWVSDDRKISFAAWAVLLAGAGLGNIWESVAVPAPAPACKQDIEPETRAGGDESRSNLDDLRKAAKAYLATLERRPRAGYVIMPTEGEAFKCSAVKPKPWGQFPGCVAYSIGDGSLYEAVGDHEEFKGMAERWEPLL